MNGDESESEHDVEMGFCSSIDEVRIGDSVWYTYGDQWFDCFVTSTAGHFISLCCDDLRLGLSENPIISVKKAVSSGKSILREFDHMASRRVVSLCQIWALPPCYHRILASYNLDCIISGFESLVFEIIKIITITNPLLETEFAYF